MKNINRMKFLEFLRGLLGCHTSSDDLGGKKGVFTLGDGVDDDYSPRYLLEFSPAGPKFLYTVFFIGIDGGEVTYEQHCAVVDYVKGLGLGRSIGVESDCMVSLA